MILTVHTIVAPALGQIASSAGAAASEAGAAGRVPPDAERVAEAPLTPPARPTTVADGIYVWMDLGQVIINTRGLVGDSSELSRGPVRTEVHSIAPGLTAGGWKLMPGAAEYLLELQESGYKVGLISNIPEEWGEAGNIEAKIRALSEIINERWTDTEHAPLDLRRFDRVLLPLYDCERKPADILYQRALKAAGDRKSLFQGETPAEIDAANNNGMAGWLIKYDDLGQPQYLPVKDIPGHVEAGIESVELLRWNESLRQLCPAR